MDERLWIASEFDLEREEEEDEEEEVCDLPQLWWEGGESITLRLGFELVFANVMMDWGSEGKWRTCLGSGSGSGSE